MHHLKKAFDFKNKEEISMFNNFLNYTHNHRDKEVYDFISEQSQNYKTNSKIRQDLVMTFDTATFVLFKAFLKKWHKEKLFRELTLLGFESTKIKHF